MLLVYITYLDLFRVNANNLFCIKLRSKSIKIRTMLDHYYSVAATIRKMPYCCKSSRTSPKTSSNLSLPSSTPRIEYISRHIKSAVCAPSATLILLLSYSHIDPLAMWPFISSHQIEVYTSGNCTIYMNDGLTAAFILRCSHCPYTPMSIVTWCFAINCVLTYNIWGNMTNIWIYVDIGIQIICGCYLCTEYFILTKQNRSNAATKKVFVSS